MLSLPTNQPPTKTTNPPQRQATNRKTIVYFSFVARLKGKRICHGGRNINAQRQNYTKIDKLAIKTTFQGG
jgi:hypothetical protein